MNQTGLAAIMGCSQQYVSRLLGGKENLTIDTLFRIERALGLNLTRFNLEVPAYSPDYSEPASAPNSDTASVSAIIRQFDTGDRPFSAICTDGKKYLCKYSRFSGSANALAREYIGSTFACLWDLSNRNLRILSLRGIPDSGTSLNRDIPALGREWLDGAVDLSEISSSVVKAERKNLLFLMRCALFDLWMCNEDRLNNNMNLLYDTSTDSLLAIDHAGIFNTSFKAPLVQLGIADSILYSDLFCKLYRDCVDKEGVLQETETSCFESVSRCRNAAIEFPQEWRIDGKDYGSILSQLFSKGWINETWNNFYFLLKQATI